MLPEVRCYGHDQEHQSHQGHADPSGEHVVCFVVAALCRAPWTIEILDQDGGHGIQRRHRGADRGRDDADRHQPAQARRHFGENEMHQHRDILTAELARGTLQRPRTHEVGAAVEDIEQRSDGEEDEDDRHAGQHRAIEAAGAGTRVLAGQQALRGVLVEGEIADRQQEAAGHHGGQSERLLEAQRNIKQAELVLSVGRRGKGADHRAQRHRNPVQQEQEHHDGCADIDDELEEVQPHDRPQAPMDREQERHQDQRQRGDQDALRADVEEHDHRDRDRGQIEARTPGQDPAHQEHGARSPHRTGVEPRAEEFIHRGDPKRVEARHEHPGHDEGREKRPEGCAEVGIVTPVARVRRPEECRGRLRGRQHRHCCKRGRDRAGGQEKVAGIERLATPQIAADGRQSDQIGDHDRPVDQAELRRHGHAIPCRSDDGS